MTWARHHIDNRWHLVVAVNDSVETACNGRWPVDDRYDVAVNPPIGERCGGCR